MPRRAAQEAVGFDSIEANYDPDETGVTGFVSIMSNGKSIGRVRSHRALRVFDLIASNVISFENLHIVAESLKVYSPAGKRAVWASIGAFEGYKVSGDVFLVGVSPTPTIVWNSDITTMSHRLPVPWCFPRQ
jgi:hypothetical protein